MPSFVVGGARTRVSSRLENSHSIILSTSRISIVSHPSHLNDLRNISGASYLQHVQQSRLSGVIESKEQKFGMFVEQAQGCQDVVDYFITIPLASIFLFLCPQKPRCVETLDARYDGRRLTPVDNPHDVV